MYASIKKVITNILDELDDILFFSILLAIMFTIGSDNVGFEFFKYFIAGFVYLCLKILISNYVSQSLIGAYINYHFYSNIEGFEIDEEVRKTKAGLIASILNLIVKVTRSSPMLFMTFLSIVTLGKVRFPVPGVYEVKHSFENIKGKREILREKAIVAVILYFVNMLISTVFHIFSIDLAEIPVRSEVMSMFPLFILEGYFLLLYSRGWWLFFFLLSVAALFCVYLMSTLHFFITFFLFPLLAVIIIRI